MLSSEDGFRNFLNSSQQGHELYVSKSLTIALANTTLLSQHCLNVIAVASDLRRNLKKKKKKQKIEG